MTSETIQPHQPVEAASEADLAAFRQEAMEEKDRVLKVELVIKSVSAADLEILRVLVLSAAMIALNGYRMAIAGAARTLARDRENEKVPVDAAAKPSGD